MKSIVLEYVTLEVIEKRKESNDED